MTLRFIFRKRKGAVVIVILHGKGGGVNNKLSLRTFIGDVKAASNPNRHISTVNQKEKTYKEACRRTAPKIYSLPYFGNTGS